MGIEQTLSHLDPIEGETEGYITADDVKASFIQTYEDMDDQDASDARYVNVSGDTMTGPLTLNADPSSNLHATTKQYVDNVLLAGLQVRQSAGITTESLDTNNAAQTTIALAKAYRLYTITTSREARVRLYTTPAKQAADLGRPIGTLPTGDHGLILEFVTTAGLLSADLSPLVDGFDGKSTPDGDIPITVTNLGGSGIITIDFIWIRSE